MKQYSFFSQPALGSDADLGLLNILHNFLTSYPDQQRMLEETTGSDMNNSQTAKILVAFAAIILLISACFCRPQSSSNSESHTTEPPDFA